MVDVPESLAAPGAVVHVAGKEPNPKQALLEGAPVSVPRRGWHEPLGMAVLPAGNGVPSGYRRRRLGTSSPEEPSFVMKAFCEGARPQSRCIDESTIPGAVSGPQPFSGRYSACLRRGAQRRGKQALSAVAGSTAVTPPRGPSSVFLRRCCPCRPSGRIAGSRSSGRAALACTSGPTTYGLAKPIRAGPEGGPSTVCPAVLDVAPVTPSSRDPSFLSSPRISRLTAACFCWANNRPRRCRFRVGCSP